MLMYIHRAAHLSLKICIRNSCRPRCWRMLTLLWRVCQGRLLGSPHDRAAPTCKVSAKIVPCFKIFQAETTHRHSIYAMLTEIPFYRGQRGQLMHTFLMKLQTGNVSKVESAVLTLKVRRACLQLPASQAASFGSLLGPRKGLRWIILVT